MLKISAYSFKNYIATASNQLDFAIVLVSIVLYLFENSGLGFIRGLRVFRALKPLRTLSRSENMKVVLKSVVVSVAAMGDVSILIFMFLVIFSIMGV